VLSLTVDAIVQRDTCVDRSTGGSPLALREPNAPYDTDGRVGLALITGAPLPVYNRLTDPLSALYVGPGMNLSSGRSRWRTDHEAVYVAYARMPRVLAPCFDAVNTFLSILS
jgi:hypothetical protein